MKRILCLIFLICQTFVCYSQGNVKDALKELDNIVANRQEITQKKLDNLQQIKDRFRYAHTDEENYLIADSLYNQYRAFSMDSAEVYALRKLSLANKMHNALEINTSKLNLAEMYAEGGLYMEALNIANTVSKHSLDRSATKYYFHIYRTLYGFMEAYAATKTFQTKYSKLKDIYRDSLINVQDKGSYYHDIIQADALLDRGYYKEAFHLLLPWLSKCDNEMMRNMGYNLAIAYRQAGNKDKEEYYFIISSIADLKSATKEYLSLLELSKILYRKGDLKRAYTYLKCSLEDAAFCNARLRTVEISEIYPIVEKAYEKQLAKKEQQRTFAFSCVSLLVLVLAIVLIYLNKQKNKLSAFRKELIKLNADLKQANENLKASNNSLLEANYIKEGSISQYIELCSVYIEKMSEYQHSLIKIASAGKVEDLYKALRSSTLIENELKDFYVYFDKSFLDMFPTFVEDFNNMLIPEGRIYPKIKGQLNIELRIFALIRLGISDSTKIAKFMRYSVTTIYNYRVKVRNAAKGDRNQLENEIMNIAKPQYLK